MSSHVWKSTLAALVALFLLAVPASPARACWVEETGTCRICGGTGERSCNYCHGGTKNCGFCHGSGSVSVRCSGCGGSGQVGDEACGDCSGEGKVTESCDNCTGTGSIVCGSCDGSGQATCNFCSGTGETVVRKTWDPDCGVDHKKGR